MEIPILYHGTDAKMISLSKEERQSYLNDCKAVANYLWQFFHPLWVDELVETIIEGNKAFVKRKKITNYKQVLNQKEPNLYHTLWENLDIISFEKNGNGNFQYNDLYLTTELDKAINYAMRSYAGGEIGFIAYSLIQGAEVIMSEGWDKDAQINLAIARIKKFAEAPKQPVILAAKNIKVESLLYENGEPFNQVIGFLLPSYRYISEVEWDVVQKL